MCEICIRCATDCAGGQLLLDTNLLLLFLAGSLDPASISKRDRTKGFDEEAFVRLSKIRAGYNLNTLLTTPNILTEVSNMTRRWGDAFFRLLQVTVASLDERYLASGRLVEHVAARRLGITDTALVELGRDRVLVATNDRDLWMEILNRGGNVLNFRHFWPGTSVDASL